MAAAFVKENTVTGASTAATSGTYTITAPASGNLLVACIALGSSTAGAQVSSLSSTGATWTRVAQSAQNATGTNRQEIWVGSGDTGTTVTLNFSAASKWAASISEWSGVETVVDVTAVTNTGSVATGTHTTTSTGLSTPGGDLIIGAMNLATSKVSTDFASTAGAPDTRTALTYSASGATTSSNVGMQAVWDIASNSFTNQTFSWVTSAAWQYAWAAVSLRATTRNYNVNPSLTGTVSPSRSTTKGLWSQFFALNRSAWTCSASDSQAFDPASNALDGSLSTRWSSGIAQYNGLWFKIDMGSVQTVSALYLNSTVFGAGDWPRGYSVTTSNDDVTYGAAIATGSGSVDNTWITFTPTSARYFKITQTGTAGNWWSIDEVYAFTQTGTLTRGFGFARSSFSSTLSATIALARTTAHALAASVSGTVSRLQQITHTISAPLTGTVSVGKALVLTLATFSGALTPTGRVARTTAHAVASTLPATVTILRATAHTLAATITGTVSIGKVLALAQASFAAKTAPAPGTLATAAAKTDTFIRTDQSGWGTASDGETWSTAVYSAPTLAISGNAGTMIGATQGLQYGSSLGGALRNPVEALGRFTLQDQLALFGFDIGGGSIRALLTYNGGQLTLAAADTQTVVNVGLGLLVSDAVWLRVRVLGGLGYIRAWKDGTTEPTTWTAIKTAVGGGGNSTMLVTVYWLYQGAAPSTPSRVDSITVTPLQPLLKTPAKTLAAQITQTVSRAQQVAHALSATITQTVSATRTTAKALASTLQQTISRSQQIAHGIASSLTGTARFGKVLALAQTTFSGALTGTTTFMRASAQTLAAPLTATAGYTTTAAKALAATVTGAGSRSQQTAHTLAAALAGAPSLARGIAHTLAAQIRQGVSFTASLASSGAHYTQALAASSTLTAVRLASTTHGLLSSLSASALVQRQVAAARGATLAPAAALRGSAGKALSAALAGAGQLRRASTFLLSGAITGSATCAQHLALRLTQAVAGTLGALGTLQRRIDTGLAAASLGALGALGRQPLHLLGAALGATGRIGSGTLHNLGALLGLAGRSRTISGPLLRRVALAVSVRLHALAALLRPQQTHAHSARASILATAARQQTVAGPPRSWGLSSKGDGMRLVAPDPSTPLTIAPSEANLVFTADFSNDLPAGTHITGVQVRAQRNDGTDVTTPFVVDSAVASTAVVTLVLGSGAQQLGTVYRVHVVVVCSNTPPSSLAGFFDLVCAE